MNNFRVALTALLPALLLCTPLQAAEERFSVITGGRTIGYVQATTEGSRTVIAYDVKNNGRGPTIGEAVEIDAAGLPTSWSIEGTETFGNKISERFVRNGQVATWTDSTGSASSPVRGPALYVAQSASPWALGLYARATLKSPEGRIAALPSGTLAVERGPNVTVSGKAGPLTVTRHTLTGIDTTPTTLLLDPHEALFALVAPSFIVVREGYEAEEERLRSLAAT